MSKIKILHIIKSLGRGGAETLLPETLKLHDKKMFEFHYVYFLPWKDQMVESLQIEGGKVTCFPANNNITLLQKSSEVIRYCKLHNIDLIHCHLPWSGFLGRIIHKRTNLPVIYTEHNIQERYHFATKILNKFSFNMQSLALGVSRDVTRSIKNNITPNIPVDTLLNGVNTEKFQRDLEGGLAIRRKYNIPDDAVLIGNLAVFRQQKNISDWLHAFNVVVKNAKNVFGLLVGSGPQEDEIKSIIKELNLEDKVFLPGLQTETVPYFSAMDIFMMSSEFEGLPIALLEAMSVNCAIVSTKAGGVVEVVRDNVDGLLCDVGNIDGLSDKVLHLIENHQELGKFKKASRLRVITEFSLENMVKNLEEVYQNVLKNDH